MESVKKSTPKGPPSAPAAAPTPAEENEADLIECSNCGRNFAAERIKTHEWICEKQKKRKPFDVSQQRVRGTDAEKFYKKNRTRNKAEITDELKGSNNWRKQHEEFILSMKAAKEMATLLKKGGNVRDLPPPPPTDKSDYIQCPTCQRKFNATAAQRHIPKCAEIQQRKPKPPPPPQKVAVKTVKPRELSARGRK